MDRRELGANRPADPTLSCVRWDSLGESRFDLLGSLDRDLSVDVVSMFMEGAGKARQRRDPQLVVVYPVGQRHGLAGRGEAVPT